MISPQQRKAEYELERNAVCRQIFQSAENELYLHMRYLDVALAGLVQQQTGSTGCWGTDGFILYFHPEYVMNRYKQDRVFICRGLLHMLLHCLFGHLDLCGDRDKRYWDLSCDIVIEQVIDSLTVRVLRVPPSMQRRELYDRLKKKYKVLTAQRVYQELLDMHMPDRQINGLAAEFYVDDHTFWYSRESKRQQPQRQNKWEDIRDRMQTEMETFGKDASEESGSLLEQVRVENRDRYDYRKFLQKFSVFKEEMQADLDSFDYIFYTYGLELYGNMPLIEPQETREVQKIEDFVIVIDTSMSCKGSLVLRFLEETYTILSQAESFFRKINLHILQCDDKVQKDTLITSRDEMDAYMADFTIAGQGGTDFRPAFGYVNELMAKKAFTKLRGLIYFTDGYGTFPMKRPPYDTAFVFWDEDYRDLDVPPWAIRLVLTEEDFKITDKTIY